MTEGYVFAGPGRDRIMENTGRKSAQRKCEATFEILFSLLMTLYNFEHLGLTLAI